MRKSFGLGLSYVVALAALVSALTFSLDFWHRSTRAAFAHAEPAHPKLFTVGKHTDSGEWQLLGRDEIEHLTERFGLPLTPYRTSSATVALPGGVARTFSVVYLSDATLNLIGPRSAASGAAIDHLRAGTVILGPGFDSEIDATGHVSIGAERMAFDVADRTEFAGIFSERPALFMHWDDAPRVSGFDADVERMSAFYHVLTSANGVALKTDELDRALSAHNKRAALEAFARGVMIMRGQADARLTALSGIHFDQASGEREKRAALIVHASAIAVVVTCALILVVISIRERQSERVSAAIKRALGATWRNLAQDRARQLAWRVLAALLVSAVLYGLVVAVARTAISPILQWSRLHDHGFSMPALIIAWLYALAGLLILEAVPMLLERWRQRARGEARIIRHAPGAAAALAASAVLVVLATTVVGGLGLAHMMMRAINEAMHVGLNPQAHILSVEPVDAVPPDRQYRQLIDAAGAAPSVSPLAIAWITQVPGDPPGSRAQVWSAADASRESSVRIVAADPSALTRLGAMHLFGATEFVHPDDTLISQALATRMGIGPEQLGTQLRMRLGGMTEDAWIPVRVAGVVGTLRFGPSEQDQWVIYTSGQGGPPALPMGPVKIVLDRPSSKPMVEDIRAHLSRLGLSARLQHMGSATEVATRSQRGLRDMRALLIMVSVLTLAAVAVAMATAIQVNLHYAMREIGIRLAVGGRLLTVAWQSNRRLLAMTMAGLAVSLLLFWTMQSRYLSVIHQLEAAHAGRWFAVPAIAAALLVAGLALALAVGNLSRIQLARILAER